MSWAVGSVLGVLLETIAIIALARPATSRYEQELGSAQAAGLDLVRLRRLPAPRRSDETVPPPAYPPDLRRRANPAPGVEEIRAVGAATRGGPS
jgi:hypothetical protein